MPASNCRRSWPLAACVVLALWAFATPAARADVLVVDAAGGPGTDFTSIVAAVAAAADGDTILVRSGSYAAFTVNDKSLTISAHAGATVLVNGRIDVPALGASKFLVLRGLTTGTPAAGQEGLRLQQCAGAVWVESCNVRGGQGQLLAGTRIVNSPFVSLVRHESRGGTPFQFPLLFGGPGLSAEFSTVALYDCSLIGSNASGSDDFGGNGGAGLSVHASQVFAGGCTLKGGNGGSADDDYDMGCQCIICGFPGGGGHAVTISATQPGSIELFDCQLRPGLGGPTFSLGQCFNGPPGLPYAGPAGSATTVPGLTRSLRASSPVPEAGTGHVYVTGQPGDGLVVLLDTAPLISLLSGGKGVPLFPGSLYVVFGFLPPDGLLDLAYIGPLLPVGVEELQVFLQGYFFTPDGLVRGSG
jgi:hypothetical protein